MNLTFMALDAELPLIREDSYAWRIAASDTFMIHTPSTGVKGALAMASEAEVIAEFSRIGTPQGYESKERPDTNWKYTIEERE